MSKKVAVGNMASAIMEGLQEYADLAAADMKKAVKKSGRTVREQIQENAPKDTGKYAASWTVKTQKETATSLELTVHSKDRYQLAHLLENGHAKRGGGRVAARPHIAPAEKSGIDQLERDIKKALGG